MVSNKVLWGWTENDTRGGLETVIARQFIKESKDEAVTIKSKVIVTENAYSAITITRALLDYCYDEITGDCPNTYFTCGVYKGRPILAFITKTASYRRDNNDDEFGAGPAGEGDGENQTDTQETKAFILEILLTGHFGTINQLLSSLKSVLTPYKASIVKWWYKSSAHNSWYTREIFLDVPKTSLNHVLYPFMDEDPHLFLKKYLASNQSLLLITGDPGVGKTSLLRHLISDFGLHADILYDEEGIKSDYVFQRWLFDKESSVLVVEDADSVLRKREDHNPLMSRFLNVAQGLIEFPNKKLIFTTNITKPSKIDEALTRPGRCYRTLKMRPLSFKESLEACNVMGWVKPKEDKQYTVAELANNRNNDTYTKVGFN